MALVTNLFRLSYSEAPLYRVPVQEGMPPDGYVRHREWYYGAASVSGSQQDTFRRAPFRSLVDRRLLSNLQIRGYCVLGGKRHYVYRKDSIVNPRDHDIYHLYDGFHLQVMDLPSLPLLLRIEPKLMVRTTGSLEYLAELGVAPTRFDGSQVEIQHQGERVRGRIVRLRNESAEVLAELDSEQKLIELPLTEVFPTNRTDVIDKLLENLGRRQRGDRYSSAVMLNRRHAFLDSEQPSEQRLTRTCQIARELVNGVFPLEFGSFRVELTAEPVPVDNQRVQ